MSAEPKRVAPWSPALQGGAAAPSSAGRTAGYSIWRNLRDWTCLLPPFAVVIVLGCIVLFPLVSIQARAFADGWDSAGRLLARPDIHKVFIDSLVLAVASVAIALPLGTVLALCVVRTPARFQGVARLIPIIPLFIPNLAVVIGWVFLLSPRQGYLNSFLRLILGQDSASGPLNIYSPAGIIVLCGFSLTSYVYLYVQTRLSTMGSELTDAAAISGAAPWQSFWYVTFPLIRPALVYSGGIVFMLGLGQFTFPLLLGPQARFKVLATELVEIKNTFPIDYGLSAVIGTPLIVIGILVVLIQVRALGDLRKYASNTAKSRSVPIRSNAFMVVPVIVYGILSAGLPLVSVVYVALSPYWNGKITPAGSFTLKHLWALLADERFIGAFQNSVLATTITVLVVVPIGFVVAAMIVSRQSSASILRRPLEILTAIPLGMPAAILGLAMLYSFAGAPFYLYGTLGIIVIGYSVAMLPHAVRPQLSSLVSLGPEYAEAARVSGAGPLRTALSITVPLARSGLGAAIAIIVILLMHEFAISMMVSSARTQVLGTLLFEYWTGGTYMAVAAIALVMVAITAIGASVALFIGGETHS